MQTRNVALVAVTAIVGIGIGYLLAGGQVSEGETAAAADATFAAVAGLRL